MHLRSCLLAGLLLALPAQALAQSAAPPCLTRAEAQNVVIFALPTAVQAVDGMCRKVLPPETGFAATAEALQKQYQPASDAAWPATRAALTKLLGNGDDPAKAVLSGFLASDDPTALRAFVTAAIGGKPMKPKTCAAIGRVLPLIQPMPAQNMAGLFEFVIEEMVNDKKEGKKPGPFTICPAPETPQ
ncbi:hypothetical protein [Novosphingobium rosa]|uniref:hypothetical protein n=1 Tax=Novosphingobium rosa TaxID=76978 RepID=UPI000A6072E2|nr:hypothetical protein [Novosphingobium rosa]